MAAILAVFFRWLHVASACVAVGGIFFARVVLPIGLAAAEDPARREVFLRARRAFKIVVHTCILLLLVSGTYNTVANWTVYDRDPALLHSLWGTHLLLGLIVFAVSLYVLAGKEPPANHKALAAFNLAVLFVLLAVAATLKYARERTVARSGQTVMTASP